MSWVEFFYISAQSLIKNIDSKIHQFFAMNLLILNDQWSLAINGMLGIEFLHIIPT